MCCIQRLNHSEIFEVCTKRLEIGLKIARTFELRDTAQTTCVMFQNFESQYFESTFVSECQNLIFINMYTHAKFACAL